jgi:ABC-2 type transport system permease protein
MLARGVNRMIPFKQDATYDYLYRLTFIRSNDYLNLFIRLTVIGAVVIFFIPNFWLKIAFALLFLYMTSFQLIPLYHHYRTSIWPDLYPISEQIPKRAFLKGMTRLSLLQTIVFASIFLIWLHPVGVLVTLLAGSLFTYLFHHGYVKRKMLITDRLFFFMVL